MITKNLQVIRAALSRIFSHNRQHAPLVRQQELPFLGVLLTAVFISCGTFPATAQDCESASVLGPLALNPCSMSAPKIYAADGTYLGRLSSNPYMTDSISNPYGRYGSPYSSTSINNPNSRYGSPYSSISPNNPYAPRPPVLCRE